MERGVLRDWSSIMLVLLICMPRGTVLAGFGLQFISDLMWVASVSWVSWVSHFPWRLTFKVRWNDDSWSVFIHKLAQRSEEIVLLLSRSSPVKFLIELLHVLVGFQVLLSLGTIQNAGSCENVLNHRQSKY